MQQYHTGPAGKGKIITTSLILAAIAILYIVVTSMNSTKASTGAHAAPATTSTQTHSTLGNSTASSSSATGSYADGTYTSVITYRTPSSREAMKVTFTIKDGSVTSSSLNQSDGNRESAAYQQGFASTYESYVVGKKLSDIQLSRISGASLTTNAFNEAVANIQSKAGGQA